MDEMSIAEIPTISKIDNIKEDFAKVLTDWQEHIGYLQVLFILLSYFAYDLQDYFINFMFQATDIDEYMDIIGLNMNTTDRKSFCISENVFQDDQLIQNLESEGCKTKQTDFKRECLQTSKIVQEPSSSNKTTGLFTLILLSYFLCYDFLL